MTNALQQNAETGFLESINPAKQTFSSEKKTKVLETAIECAKRGEYPSIANLCDAFDISMRTFYTHLDIDQAFAEEWKEVKLRIESHLVDSLHVKAKTANGFMANIALLRDINPRRWNQDQRVVISADAASTKGVLEGAHRVYDAEIVPNQPAIAPQAEEKR